ncbi:Vigilin [Portunus trituberculatus]|uniref:Vigilin n=1 Tax=Portunus trituberculatus TaxID=210409 RepID=A0A5B7CLA2_PORTR|nr:Vigilin [Portunus trituberculatus]
MRALGSEGSPSARVRILGLKRLKRLLCCCWGGARQRAEEEEESLPVRCGDSSESESPQGSSGKDTGGASCAGGMEIQAHCSATTAIPTLPPKAQRLPRNRKESRWANQSQREEPVNKLPVRCGHPSESQSQQGSSGEGSGRVSYASITKTQTPRCTTTAATPVPQPPKPHRTPRNCKDSGRREEGRDRVRDSWRESTVRVAVPVPPKKRRHVIGTRGDAIRQLQQQYPAVRVSVPRPQDITSGQITIVGPKAQADAATLHITRRLQALEEENLHRAEARCQERQRVVVKVEVPPTMRRHVVGGGGEALRRLAQAHPAVRVTVPPPSDTRTASVTISGPRQEAALAADRIKASVQAAIQRQCQSQFRRQRRYKQGKQSQEGGNAQAAREFQSVPGKDMNDPE